MTRERAVLQWPGKGAGPSPVTSLEWTVDQRVGGGDNLLLCADNLLAMDALMATHAGKIDLVYLDPPFATGQDFVRTSFVGPDGEAREELRAHAYADRWPGGIVGLLNMLEPRLRRVHRLLAPHGSFYVHVDPTAGHYIKILLDEIFGEACFQREIVWRIGWLSGYKTRANNWIRNHDLIFFYTKDPARFVFNKHYVPYPEGYVRRDGSPPRGRGVALDDVWNANAAEFELTGKESLDSIQIKSFSREKTGWATQKNESLLKRIVAASSNPGDLVADFFCGSGTTLVAAQQLGRRFVGCDSSAAAVDLAHARLVDNSAGFDRCSLGTGERRVWSAGSQAVHVRRVLAACGATACEGALDGVRDQVGVKVGPWDGAVTRAAAEEAVRAAAERGIAEVEVVAWAWEFAADEDLSAGTGVALTCVQAGRALLDERGELGAGLAERPALRLAWRDRTDADGHAAQVVLEHAAVKRPERLAPAMRRSWGELLESWSVEFAGEPGPMRPDERHHRTRAQRELALASGVHRYAGPGPYKARVLVCDRLGGEHRQAFTLAWVEGKLVAGPAVW